MGSEEGRVSFCFITANYMRPRILRLWCAGVQRLRREIGYHFPAVVVSEEEDQLICQQNNIKHIYQQNEPVSEKFNTACRYAQTQNVDYVVIIGSDDIVSTDTMNRLWDEMDTGYDVIGITNVYFYAATGPHMGQMLQLKGTRMLGTCKCVNKRVLDKIGWRPWIKKKNWGLDSVASKAIVPHTDTWKQISEVKVFDCKSRVNMNKYSHFHLRLGSKEDPQVFYDILSEEERNLLAKC